MALFKTDNNLLIGLIRNRLTKPRFSLSSQSNFPTESAQPALLPVVQVSAMMSAMVKYGANGEKKQFVLKRVGTALATVNFNRILPWINCNEQVCSEFCELRHLFKLYGTPRNFRRTPSKVAAEGKLHPRKKNFGNPAVDNINLIAPSFTQ